MAGLPQFNPPIPTNFLCAGLDSYSVSRAIIKPAQSLDCPPQGSVLPPVYGNGRVIVVSFFQGWTWGPIGPAVDTTKPPVYAGIGVRNPSEYDLPMRPLRGVLYPTNWPIFRADAFCFNRIDAITLTDGDNRSWTMNSNPNNPPPRVRGDWPGLIAGIVNNTNADVVFNDVSFGAYVVG